ncbi:MAG: glycosyltransferase [Acidimicrobiales bacterium]
MSSTDLEQPDEMNNGCTPLPFVSLLLPVRNGAEFIDGCLERVADLDYPSHRLEVLIIDGNSEDESALVAARALRRHGLVGSVLNNPGRSIASNLNAGLAIAVGSIVSRIDVKTRIPRHYLRTAVELLNDPRRSMVGGGIVAAPSATNSMARGIARAHNNPVVMGGASYRLRQGAGFAETVYLGTATTSELVRIGGWSEDLSMNEDYDLCQRLGASDSVWFDDRLTAEWLAPSRASAIVPRYRGFGRSKVKYWRKRVQSPSPRQQAILAAATATGVAATASLWWLPMGQVIGGSVTAAATTLLAIEGRFSPDDTAPLGDRLISGLVIAPLIGYGWLSGIALEAIKARVKSPDMPEVGRPDVDLVDNSGSTAPPQVVDHRVG